MRSPLRESPVQTPFRFPCLGRRLDLHWPNAGPQRKHSNLEKSQCWTDQTGIYDSNKTISAAFDILVATWEVFKLGSADIVLVIAASDGLFATAYDNSRYVRVSQVSRTTEMTAALTAHRRLHQYSLCSWERILGPPASVNRDNTSQTIVEDR